MKRINYIKLASLLFFYLSSSSTVYKAGKNFVGCFRQLSRTGWISQINALAVYLRQSLSGDLNLKLGSSAAYIDRHHCDDTTKQYSHNTP